MTFLSTCLQPSLRGPSTPGKHVTFVVPSDVWAFFDLQGEESGAQVPWRVWINVRDQKYVKDQLFQGREVCASLLHHFEYLGHFLSPFDFIHALVV